MSENASAATRRIIPSLPRAHLEHAELALGFVVFELESSREIRLEVEPGLLSRPDLPLYVVAVEVEFHRLVGANPERHAVAFVDGDLGRAHLAVLDGEIERPLLRPAGRAVRAQQEVQPAQDDTAITAIRIRLLANVPQFSARSVPCLRHDPGPTVAAAPHLNVSHAADSRTS